MYATRLVSVLLILAAAAPASAGSLVNAAANTNLESKITYACTQEKAKSVLIGNDMSIVAVVPQTKSLHRFVVNWKREMFAVTVSRKNCGIDVVDYARAIEPYCHYVDPLINGCRLDMGLAN